MSLHNGFQTDSFALQQSAGGNRRHPGLYAPDQSYHFGSLAAPAGITPYIDHEQHWPSRSHQSSTPEAIQARA
jgi:hypothetical protein